MRAYNPLYEYLARQPGAAWPASFGEVEHVLGRALPASARQHRAWWSNQTGQGHSQSHAWREAGWRTTKVDLAEERVEFVREQRRDVPFPPVFHDDLLAQAARLSGIQDREQLVREGLLALVARESARRLARLGGAMPDLDVPDRRRGL